MILDPVFTTSFIDMNTSERKQKLDSAVKVLSNVVFAKTPIKLELLTVEKNNRRYYCISVEDNITYYDSIASQGEALRLLMLVFNKDIIEAARSRVSSEEKQSKTD